jgi:PKD repeat protein
MTDHNCQDSAKHPVKIVAAPFAQFSFSPEYGVPPLEVSFENSSLGANNYLWSFGDNESSTLTNPTHTFQDLGIFKIMLSAYNAIGCLDTVSAKVYVLPTTVDIAILNATVNEANGRLYATADLLNQGTRKIEHIDMAIDFGNGYLLHEQWVGNLYEGESIHYEFAVSSQIPKDDNVNFVCIRALLPDLTDDKPENNTSCIAMKDDFLIITPYPNPVMDLINFVYILPFTEQVTIDIADGMGRMVKVIYNGEAMEGYNSLQTDLSELHSGVYTVRIAFRDKVLRQKFVKM